MNTSEPRPPQPRKAIDLEPVRRRDRSIQDADWIRDYLLSAPFGFLATVREGRPFVVPNIFVFDPEREAIYLHSARRGTTRTNLESPHRVAFSVAEIGRVLPADEALHFSVRYASVVVHGRGGVVEDDAEAKAAMGLLMAKYAPDLEPRRDYRPTSTGDLAKTSVYRIEIESWSGKRNADEPVAADEPGAGDGRR